MSDDELFLRTSARGATFDVTDAGWFADYVHADDFLRPLMTSEGIKTTQSSNVSYFDQPSIHVQLREAAQRGGAAGRQAYERIERHLRVDEVPYVALASDSRTVLVSKRIGCRIANPVYGLDLGALCIKHR